MTVTAEQKLAAMEIVIAVGQAIKELGSVPSGTLYANLMKHLSMNEYDMVIEALIRTKLVKRDGNHLLTWMGPR